MIIVKIKANEDPGSTDNLVFFLLPENDGKNIADKIDRKFQDMLDKTLKSESGSYYETLDKLTEWCGDEFGEIPHVVANENIQSIEVTY